MDYALIKTLHVSAAVLSITGFLARGLGALAGAQWVRSRAARSLPHVVDTVLLLCGLSLAWMLRLSPHAAPWLAAKLIALVVYIGLGMVALKPGRPVKLRAVALAGALLAVGYIVAVALGKQAWPFAG